MASETVLTMAVAMTTAASLSSYFCCAADAATDADVDANSEKERRPRKGASFLISSLFGFSLSLLFSFLPVFSFPDILHRLRKTHFHL